jgi:hypothetical protein
MSLKVSNKNRKKEIAVESKPEPVIKSVEPENNCTNDVCGRNVVIFCAVFLVTLILSVYIL